MKNRCAFDERAAQRRVWRRYGVGLFIAYILLSKGASAVADEATKVTQPVEVEVRGKPSDIRSHRESAESVKVLDTQNARRESRDLGDVLAGIEGVAIRRSGGLGSYTRFSLNGLYDNQVKFFFDGVPLDIFGGSIGVASIPVNLVDRIEVYRGVLPVRLGADALGGAINLVSHDLRDSTAYLSYQRGSFGTHRATASARYRHDSSGFVVGANAWLDRTRNDFDVDVEVADKTGRVSNTPVRRFHDEYSAGGGGITLALLDRPYAKRLSLQLFGSALEKDVQHDVVMARPFGEATFGGNVFGGLLRYEQPLRPALDLAIALAGSRQTYQFMDVSEWVYDWYGQRVGRRNRPGELFREPRDSFILQSAYFGRAEVRWNEFPGHEVRLATTLRSTARTGREKGITGPNGIDPLAGSRGLTSLVTGLEYQLNLFPMGATKEASIAARKGRDRLENIAFVKHYYFHADAEDVLVQASLQSMKASGHTFGVGDGLRFRLSKSMAIKASYELATRIPSIDELFGDGLYIVPNVELAPESSHNANAGFIMDTRRTRFGVFMSEANFFLRDVQGLIAATPDTTGIQYKNVDGARALGVEGSLKWLSPKNFLTLEANATWQDVRNRSTQGPFAKYDGERIPNRPWAFANWTARLQWRRLLVADDVLSPFYFGRYVHEFFRNWESIGNVEFKATVPSQVYHTVGLTYASSTLWRSSVTFEVDNVTNAQVYDFYGVQRPGRAFSVKVTADM